MKKKIAVILSFALLVGTVFFMPSCGRTGEKEDVTDGKENNSVNLENYTSDSTTEERTTAFDGGKETTVKTENTTEKTQTAAEQKETTTEKIVTTAENTAAGGSFSPADVACIIGGANVKPGKSFENIKGSLGDPSAVTQAQSCHYDGTDNIYSYGGCKIYTYFNGGEEIIYDVEISSSSIKTAAGLKVGDSADKITSLYGDGYLSFDEYSAEYSSGGYSMFISVDNGEVVMIELYEN